MSDCRRGMIDAAPEVRYMQLCCLRSRASTSCERTLLGRSGSRVGQPLHGHCSRYSTWDAAAAWASTGPRPLASSARRCSSASRGVGRRSRADMPAAEHDAVTCARHERRVCGAWRLYGRTVLVRADEANGVALGGARAPEGRESRPPDAAIREPVSGAIYTGVVAGLLPILLSMRLEQKARKGTWASY